MLKYINLPINLIKMKITPSLKILFGTLIALTRKGTTQTTVSNLYLGAMMNKTGSQISVMLKDLKDRRFIKVGRELGRRTIRLNVKPLKEAGLLDDLRPKKIEG